MAAKREPETTSHGELRVRVDAVERDVGHIEQQVTAIRDAMATKADIQAIFARIEGLSNQYSALSKPNYALQVAVATAIMLFLGLLGGFAYWPISTATTDLKTAVIALSERTVSQKQYDADQAHDGAIVRELRNDLTLTTNSTVQVQRFNTESARVSAELSLLRDKSITRQEFEVQHRDLQNQTTDRFSAVVRRLERLEGLHIGR